MKVLISKKTHKYYYVTDLSQDYHCKEGVISKEDLNSQKSVVCSHSQKEFVLFDAHHRDRLQKMKRVAQVILPKDFGYIASRTSMNSKSVVIEAGSGSGFSGVFFSGICKELHTYERVEEHFNQAQKNLEKYGFSNVTIQQKDIIEEFEKKNISQETDIVILDLPEPINVLEQLSTIKNGAFIVCYLPSIIQVDELMKYCAKGDTFFVEEVSETQIREWKVSAKSVRPQHHKECDFTAFLVFIRYLKN